MNNTTLELQLQTLPDNPGVYQYYDKEGKILYVGKAKNLKKRVLSYFTKSHDNNKTAVLVKKIVEIKHIVVSTEQDALLLENNLIKKLQPRYNVLLRDDKTYPWICIKKEPFSRIFSTRKMIKDGSEYFGPYTSFKTVNTLLDLIKELYPLRTCHYDLSEANIKSNKYKVCLEYHIGNCKGPCEGFELLEKLEEYNGKTINKSFFEKYFTFTNEKGEISKNYQDELNTSFRISKSDYSFSKNQFNIYLHRHNRIELENRDRIHIIERTKEQIQSLQNWRDKVITERDFYKNFDLWQFKTDLKDLLTKYNATEYWYYIHNEIPFLN
jgi:hypothetical protein